MSSYSVFLRGSYRTSLHHWSDCQFLILKKNPYFLFLRDRGATLRSGGRGGGGSPLVIRYWGDTRHLFLLNLYNSKNNWGGRGARAPRPPLRRGPWFLFQIGSQMFLHLEAELLHSICNLCYLYIGTSTREFSSPQSGCLSIKLSKSARSS